MFKAVKAKTVKEYLAAVPAKQKDDFLFLHTLIQKTAPKLKPHFAHNMIGYGSFPYRNYKNESIMWPTVSLASQKNYISLYVCALDKDGYIAEKYKNELGKVSVGKSCIRIKKVADVNVSALKKVLKYAEKRPGFPQNLNKKK